jgi:isopentenyl diphosphate isomerase/L-lactate dehydrogenase-like FMN-dependent dehydrogenase
MVHNHQCESYLWRLTHPGRMLAYQKALSVSYGDRGLGLDFITELRAMVDKLTPPGRPRIPIIVKGISSFAEAAAAIRRGVDGLVVSNHGGRQHDGQRAALDALREVVAAAHSKPVFFDSGVRTGEDVYKALALGATAVLVGRPIACAQIEGYRRGGKRLAATAVHGTLTNIMQDLKATMYRMSRPSIDHISERDVVFHPLRV